MTRRPTGLAEASARPAPIVAVQRDEPAPVKSDPAKSRVGKKMVAGWYDRAAVIQLQRLAVEQETTMQELVGKAIDLLFRAEGLPPLASVGREHV